MNTTLLLSWFDAGWSLDAAARVVALHQRLRPDEAPEAHEAAAVRDEVHALVRGIMAECELPDPVQRQTKAHTAPHPDIEGAVGYVAEDTVSVSSEADAVHRLASIVMHPDGLAVTYNDLTGMATHLAELADKPGPAGDMWWLDAAVVKVLQRGEAGAEKARERWRKANAAMRCAWRYTRPLVEIPPELNMFGASATYLSEAMALVLDVARERVRERERQRAAVTLEGAKHRGVAVVRPVAAGLLAMSPQQALRLEGPAPVAAVDGRVFGRIDADVAEHAHLLSSVPGQRLFMELVRRAHSQVLAEHPLANIVQFDGGWSALHNKFGGAKDTPWENIAKAGQGLRLEYADNKFGGLWTYRSKRGGPGAPGFVRFTVGEALLPGAFERFSKHTYFGREARRLVPVLDFEPPVGRLDTSKHAAVWRAQNGLLVAMVDRAAAGEVEEHGGALLDEKAWRRIASNAGLEWNDVERMLGAWLDGDNDKAPPLIMRDGDLIRLAEPHAPQWAFIVEGGARRVKGRASGKAAAKSRQSDEVGARRSKRGRK